MDLIQDFGCIEAERAVVQGTKPNSGDQKESHVGRETVRWRNQTVDLDYPVSPIEWNTPSSQLLSRTEIGGQSSG